MTIRAGIFGATGYVGIELVRLLQQHPEVELTCLTTESHAGQAIQAVYPHLKGRVSLEGERPDVARFSEKCDVAFLALPAGKAAAFAAPLLDSGKKVIDLSPDFRLRDPSVYARWYPHTAAPVALLAQAVYGLPELGDRAAIRRASLIACPGCYPTAVLLAAMPASRADLVKPDSALFDAKSGISGAGRLPQARNHFCEVMETVIPYHLAGEHRHTPEIEQALGAIAGRPLTVQFTPQLVPMTRGILATCYFDLTQPLSQKDADALYRAAYRDAPFVHICAPGEMPHVKHVRGTNDCHLGVWVDPRTQRLIVVSTIDNLIKGAAGQAVQNMNLLYDWPETTGLLHAAIYP